jgi:hypothetical protein
MDNHEISPELKKQLESLQDVPERGLQASHAGREQYLAQVRNIEPRRSPAKAAGKQARTLSRRSWAARLASIGAVVLIALSSLGGTVYAAQAAQPDDLLYGVKTLTEDVQIGLERDPEDRLDLLSFFASRRLAEIEAQADAGLPLSEEAIHRLEQHNQQMLQEAAGMQGGNLEKALYQVQQSLELQNQVMTKLQKQTPGGGEPGLIKAQETVKSRLRLVENGITEPQGFQEQLRIEQSDQPGSGQKNSNPDGPGNSDESPGSDNGTDMQGGGNGNGPGGR